MQFIGSLAHARRSTSTPRSAYRFDVVAVIAPGTRSQEVALYRNAF